MSKLLGYRLKEECEDYREAAESITGISKMSDRVNFEKNSYAYYSIKQAGVMHWFEEVYEEEKKPQAGEYWFHSTGQLELILEYIVVMDIVKTQPIHTCVSTGRFASHGVCTMNRKATTEEIQQALIKEAKKRGFKEGVEVNKYCFKDSIDDCRIGFSKKSKIRSNTFIYFEDVNVLWIDGNSIFHNGKWAEILPTETLNGKTAIIDGVEYELKLKN